MLHAGKAALCSQPHPGGAQMATVPSQLSSPPEGLKDFTAWTPQAWHLLLLWLNFVSLQYSPHLEKKIVNRGGKKHTKLSFSSSNFYLQVGQTLFFFLFSFFIF